MTNHGSRAMRFPRMFDEASVRYSREFSLGRTRSDPKTGIFSLFEASEVKQLYFANKYSHRLPIKSGSSTRYGQDSRPSMSTIEPRGSLLTILNMSQQILFVVHQLSPSPTSCIAFCSIRIVLPFTPPCLGGWLI